jgi:hypothetical protein
MEERRGEIVDPKSILKDCCRDMQLSVIAPLQMPKNLENCRRGFSVISTYNSVFLCGHLGNQ